MRDWELSRRDLLRRLGVGLACLPLLQGRGARAAAPGKRLICVVQTHGYRPATWRPKVGRLADQTLPASLRPLDPWKQQLIVLPELANPTFTGCGTCGPQAYGTIFWGRPPAAGGGAYPVPAGPTVDQMIAAGLSPAAGGRRSLALGALVELPPLSADTLGSRRCFWGGAGAPINPQNDPAAAYADLFGGAAVTPAAVLGQRKLVMDYVGKSLQRFGARLGRAERVRVEQHLEATRDVERTLSAMPATKCGAIPPNPAAPLDPATPGIFAKVVEAQLQLAVAALACGITNVVTVQLTDAFADNVDVGLFVPGIPAGGGSQGQRWSDVARAPAPGGSDYEPLVDAWCMSRLADLLARLNAMPEGGGTLLDSSLVLWANIMESGDTRNPQKVPWILAGKAGGALDTGQCAPSAGKPLASVLAAVSAACGVAPGALGAPMAGILKG